MDLQSPSGAREPHNIDDIESRLYNPKAAKRPDRTENLRPMHSAVNTEWSGVPQPPKNPLDRIPTSSFKKFFRWSLGFLAFALVFAAIMLFTGGNTVSNNAIEVNVLGNSFASGGEELPLQIEVVNKNAGALELVDLFVEYDKGGDASGGAGHVRDLYSLGTIEAGRTVTKHIFVTVYGEQGSGKDIRFTLQYRLRGSNAVFVKDTVFSVTISSAPVTLSVDAPENLTPNQDVKLSVKVKSNTQKVLSGMLLRVDYPTGFKFDGATPSATSLNNLWDLGDLAPGAEREIVITGSMHGADGEERAFHVYTGAKSAADATKIGVTYNSHLSVVKLVKPFLAAHILINGSDELTVPVSGGQINASVVYSNNLPTPVTNAQVTLALSGNVFDPSSVVVPEGFFNSSNNTVIWNATTDPRLGSIAPGGQGVLQVSLKTKPLAAGGTAVSAPSVKFSVSIKGKQPDAGGAVAEVTDFEERTAVVSSDLGFAASASHFSGPFANTGPVPPKANEPTTYTVTWTVTNSANALSSGTAISTLPTYVDWVGTVSPAGTPISYDDTTRSVRWNIGQIPAGTGLSAPSKSVSFQVRFNASTSQVNTSPALTLGTTVTARDTFTGQQLTASRGGVTTLLQNDPGFPAGGGIVTN